mmetsp:Transcript_73676/g.213431  ORF Transcript_73676/g.213431 Transcript_73676/m.213431 type:complete len:128 (-) Transcript_73676:3741-4124(-)
MIVLGLQEWIMQMMNLKKSLKMKLSCHKVKTKMKNLMTNGTMKSMMKWIQKRFIDLHHLKKVLKQKIFKMKMIPVKLILKPRIKVIKKTTTMRTLQMMAMMLCLQECPKEQQLLDQDVWLEHPNHSI